ncbi:hypothetical protein BDK92_5286 [Micromonospora pisi]|uniref:WD40 repeat protein n=1 Tax=Micromonospora pisi TaxID=589240 RepID=A0A495JR91_9ACTN|nr:hypothetical protein [Micromonospora pisi]RKR90902.1 hypothetical protein BDK92_5286 [Micromonospora pisi]
MRRVLSSVVVIGGVVGASLGLAATPALAAPAKVCTIDDDRTNELSGLVATKTGYVAINDGTDVESHDRVFFLSSKCKVTKSVPYVNRAAADPEDLALSADGKTIWIADIGDNPDAATRRRSVVLWSLPADGSGKTTLHRLAYPGNKPHDAEALLMGADGTPYIITKTGAEKSEIYRPTAPLQKDNAEGVPMELAGEITLPKSTTENLLTATGRLMVTGAATSPDGKRIVLRTYADAFEWDVPDGDIVKALTTSKPRMTPLADAFGEAIAYTPDGKSFVTVSDVGSLADDTDVVIQSYVPSTKVAEVAAAADGDGAKSESGKSWTADLTLTDITYLIAAVGVFGALLVGLGIFGIVRARKARAGGAAEPANPAGDPDGPRNGAQSPGEDSFESPPPPRGTTYGGGGQGAGPGGYRPGGEYEPPGRPPAGVYGGQPAGGAVYGGNAPAGPRPPAGGAGVYGGGPGRPGSPGQGPVYGAGRGGYPAPADPRGATENRQHGQPANGYGPGQPANGYGPGQPANGYGPGQPANGYGRPQQGGQYGQPQPQPQPQPRPGQNGYPERGYPDQGYPEQGHR